MMKFWFTSGFKLRYSNHYRNLFSTHYCPNTELAFNRVDHICRDLNYGRLLRTLHANWLKSLFWMRKIDWLIGLLLVTRFRLVEEIAVEVFHHYGVHMSSFFLCKISNPFRENNNLVVFPFPSHISMPLANVWFIRLQG